MPDDKEQATQGMFVSACSSANPSAFLELLEKNDLPRGLLMCGDTLLHTTLNPYPGSFKNRYLIIQKLVELGFSPQDLNENKVTCASLAEAMLTIVKNDFGEKSEQYTYLKLIIDLFRGKS